MFKVNPYRFNSSAVNFAGRKQKAECYTQDVKAEIKN